MMDVRSIRTDADYDWALKEVEQYFEHEPAPGTPEAERFGTLVALIGAYEAKSWAIEVPDLVAILKAAQKVSPKTEGVAAMPLLSIPAQMWREDILGNDVGEQQEPGTVFVDGKLIYSLSDEARAKAPAYKASAIFGFGEEIQKRQQRILDAVKLSLMVDAHSHWWTTVDVQGRHLVGCMRNTKLANAKEYIAMANGASKLKNMITKYFEKAPDKEDLLLWNMIGHLHVLAERAQVQASSIPKRQPSRPTKDNEIPLIKGLAQSFSVGFGHAPTQTRNGAFERFVSAIIFEIGGITQPPGWIIEKMRGGGEKSKLF